MTESDSNNDDNESNKVSYEFGDAERYVNDGNEGDRFASDQEVCIQADS